MQFLSGGQLLFPPLPSIILSVGSLCFFSSYNALMKPQSVPLYSPRSLLSFHMRFVSKKIISHWARALRSIFHREFSWFTATFHCKRFQSAFTKSVTRFEQIWPWDLAEKWTVETFMMPISIQSKAKQKNTYLWKPWSIFNLWVSQFLVPKMTFLWHQRYAFMRYIALLVSSNAMYRIKAYLWCHKKVILGTKNWETHKLNIDQGFHKYVFFCFAFDWIDIGIMKVSTIHFSAKSHGQIWSNLVTDFVNELWNLLQWKVAVNHENSLMKNASKSSSSVGNNFFAYKPHMKWK